MLLPNVGTIVIVVLLLSANHLLAQNGDAAASQTTSDTTLNYQGHLLDSAGQPVNTTVPITFRLYDSYIGGTELWIEQHPTVPVQYGLFNVALGSITPLPTTLFSDNAELWLGVQIDSDSEMVPRERLGDVPFASRALIVPDESISADQIADDSITGAEVADGSLELGDTTFLAGTVAISGTVTGCAQWGSETHCYKDVTVTHDYGEANYLVLTGTHHGVGAGRYTISIYNRLPNSFRVRMTAINAAGDWDDSHEVIVHWLLIPLSQ